MNETPFRFARMRTHARLLRALVAVALGGGPAAALGGDYYVSPAGDDSHDGRGAEPARAFQTVQRAVDALNAGDRLLVRAGTYRETVTFPRDGEPGAPIVVMAYPGEQPVISGLEPLTGWTPIGNDRWTTAMPWTLGLGKNQLFANGVPLVEARYPNASAPGLAITDENGVELPQPWPRFAAFSIPDYSKPFEVNLPLGQTCPAGGWDGAIYVGQHWDGWQAQCGIVESSGGATLTVTTALQGWWYPKGGEPGTGITDGGRGMLVGHSRALDAAGEWVRAADGTVTLQQAPGVTPTAIEAKRRLLALQLTGRRHIEVRGLQFLGASACLREAHACVLQGCTFEWFAHYTWFAGVAGDIDPNDNFEPMHRGETSIYLGGSGNTVRDCTLRGSAGGGVSVDGYDQTVHNCLIEHTGYAGTYQEPICFRMDQYQLRGGHRITRNTLRHGTRAVFGIYGIYQNSPARLPVPYAASLIEGNDLHTAMLMGRDGGVVYSWMTDGGAWNGVRTLFRRNVLHDCHGEHVPGLFYFDNGCWNYDVRENVLWSSPRYPVERAHFYYAPSLNTSWENNRFFFASDKTAATLTSTDFPNGQPFAFGHDFAHAPAIPTWRPVREHVISPVRSRSRSPELALDGAVLTGWREGAWASFDLPNVARWQTVVISADVTKAWGANISRQWPGEPRHLRTTDPLPLAMLSAADRSPDVATSQGCAFGLRNGSWLKFGDVALGAGFRQVRLWYASGNSRAKHAELRLDRRDGPVIATIPLPDASGTPQPPSNMLAPEAVEVAAVSPATGTHDLYLMTVGDGEEELVQLFQANLEGYRGALPRATDELCLEVRARDKDGPVLTRIYPAYPDGYAHDWVAALDPAQVAASENRVCLVVRTVFADPGLRVGPIRFQRGPMR